MFSSRPLRVTDYRILIALSAFLLFAVEPMTGKHLLPYLGGSAGVWATCLSFFTTVLFIGYMYVYVLRKYPLKTQGKIHSLIVGVGTILWLLQVRLGTQLLPGLDSSLFNVSAPVMSTLLIMFLYIGFPFFVLATTSSLLQQWYAFTHEKEPYSLYTLSNIGSLLALLAYPFFIEPYIPLSVQEYAWSVMFFAYAVVYALFARRIMQTEQLHKAEKEEGVTLRSLTQWTLLSAFPAFVLIAATSHITTIIAPIPMLWVLPLALYLITFIVTFAGVSIVAFWPLMLIFFAMMLVSAIDSGYSAIAFQLIGSVGFVGFVGMTFHGYLYELRPHHSQSAQYYAAISFGGMLGTIIASIMMPLLLTKITEFYWSIGIAAVIAVFLLPRIFFQKTQTGYTHIGYRLFFACFVWVTIFGSTMGDVDTNVVHQSRNFYGTAEVREYDDRYTLSHGNTMHGVQARDESEALIPSSYYTTDSGVGRSIRAMKAAYGSVHVGVVGLGTGTLAAYCEPGDTFTFYEIDQRMVMIANTFFTYLDSCPDVEVRMGDARISLQKDAESGESLYDVLAIDAFSDDSIPMHLLTNEAVALYMTQVREGGAVAIHVSNRYLDLAPVVHRIAQELGVASMEVSAQGVGTYGSGSTWVVLSNNEKLFSDPRFSDMSYDVNPEQGPLWTDDFNALSSVISIPMPDFITTVQGWFESGDEEEYEDTYSDE
jgi:spermidine synthase